MENLSKAKRLVNEADVVIVTAGAGFAKGEGLDLLGQSSFDQSFPDIAQKYDVHSVGDALDKKLASPAEQWLFWSKLIQKYSLDYKPSQTMRNLRKIIGERKFFIATTCFGHFFETAGFNDKRIFNVFGDWTRMQCSSGVNHGYRDDRETVSKILQSVQQGHDIDQLVPRCQKCGQPMEIHLPLNDHFYPDTDANTRFRWFLTGNEEEKVVFLELGVDETSPQLFDPIIHLVQEFPLWSYVAADYQQETFPLDIQVRAAGINADSTTLIQELVKK